MALFTSMLLIIVKAANNKTLGTQANRNKKNQDISSSIGYVGGANGVIDGNKNLLIIAKLKNLAKSQILKIAKNNFKTDFFILGAKKAFIHL